MENTLMTIPTTFTRLRTGATLVGMMVFVALLMSGCSNSAEKAEMSEAIDLMAKDVRDIAEVVDANQAWRHYKKIMLKSAKSSESAFTKAVNMSSPEMKETNAQIQTLRPELIKAGTLARVESTTAYLKEGLEKWRDGEEKKHVEELFGLYASYVVSTGEAKTWESVSSSLVEKAKFVKIYAAVYQGDDIIEFPPSDEFERMMTLEVWLVPDD